MPFNTYRPPPRLYNQANEAGWIQNLLGKTYGAPGVQVSRIPLVTRIVAASSMAAMLSQPIPNLNATTLKPATAHELNLEAGSYAITGADLTALADRALNLEAGSYTITGADLTAPAGRSLNLEAGSYAVTGADLTTLADRTLNLEAGSYAITGADATLLAARTLNLEAGSYSITGADATLVYVQGQAPFYQTEWPNPQPKGRFHYPNMFRPAQAAPAQPTPKPFLSQDWPNPAPRPINLAAYGYTVRRPENQKPFSQTDWPNPRRVQARQDFVRGADRVLYSPVNAYSLNLEAGSYVITGADAVLVHSGTPTAYDLNLEAGSYVITGADLTTLAARTLNLEAGSYSLTGADLTALAGRSLNLEAGTYAITGADLTALVARVLNLEPGTFTITGADATLQGPSAIIDGDEVQVVIAPDGIACTVLTEAGTTVKVVISSAKQIHVLTEGGAPIKVII